MNMSRLLIPFFLLNSTCDKQRPDMSGQAASIMSCCITSCVQDAGNHLWVTQEAEEAILWSLKQGWGGKRVGKWRKLWESPGFSPLNRWAPSGGVRAGGATSSHGLFHNAVTA